MRATAANAHAVHVEPDGLRPGREYWYRFRLGRFVSPTGRTRTAPAYGTDPAYEAYGGTYEDLEQPRGRPAEVDVTDEATREHDEQPERRW